MVGSAKCDDGGAATRVDQRLVGVEAGRCNRHRVPVSVESVAVSTALADRTVGEAPGLRL